ncbi:MAG: ClbS/DfsB family four-helix bundle protein [Candidatus Limivivens sp.]|nr:ClbS/DfsB family four-helix bundle protein [Candidatus Limivivens sp.]
MPRPRDKEALINAANTNFEKLLTVIENRSENEKTICYDFSNDEKKKEAHWKRDRNLRDVLMHLNEWHLLLLEWIQNRENGTNRPFLLEGYTWKTYGEMNLFFYNRCKSITESEALERLKASHRKVMEALETFSQEELFTSTYYPWVGGSCIGSYFISTTSSHYDWAIKKIKAHQKNCKQMEERSDEKVV